MAAWVLRSLPDLAAEDFTQLARRYGVEVVVEKVETERQVVDILDLNIGFGQGHLFGEPRAIKEAVLSKPARRSTSSARSSSAGRLTARALTPAERPATAAR